MTSGRKLDEFATVVTGTEIKMINLSAPKLCHMAAYTKTYKNFGKCHSSRKSVQGNCFRHGTIVINLNEINFIDLLNIKHEQFRCVSTGCSTSIETIELITQFTSKISKVLS